MRDLVNKEGLQIYHGYEDTVIKPIYVLDRTTKSGVVIGGPGEFNVFSTGGTPFDPSAGVNADYKIKVDRSGNITITKSKDESDMQDSTVKVKGSLDFSLGTDGKIKVSVKDENGKLAPIEQFFAPPNISQPTRP